MFSEILDSVYSVDDQMQLLNEIDILLDSMYKLGDGSFEPTMRAQVRADVAQLISQTWSKSKMDIHDFLKSLRGQVSNLKTVEIQIAYQPSVESTTMIHDWVGLATSRGFVLSFVYIPDLVGGAVISFKGKSHNASLQEKIHQKLNNE